MSLKSWDDALREETQPASQGTNFFKVLACINRDRKDTSHSKSDKDKSRAKKTCELFTFCDCFKNIGTNRSLGTSYFFGVLPWWIVITYHLLTKPCQWTSPAKLAVEAEQQSTRQSTQIRRDMNQTFQGRSKLANVPPGSLFARYKCGSKSKQIQNPNDKGN